MSSWVVYFVRAGERGPIKIGFTRNAKKRMEMLQNGNHERLSKVATLDVEGEHEARELERAFHDACRDLRIGRSEWFRPRGDLLAVIMRMALIKAGGRDRRLWLGRSGRYAFVVEGARPAHGDDVAVEWLHEPGEFGYEAFAAATGAARRADGTNVELVLARAAPAASTDAGDEQSTDPLHRGLRAAEEGTLL